MPPAMVPQPDPMPLAQTSKAPRFSLDPIGFKLFFDLVEELAGCTGISDPDAIKWAIHYHWGQGPVYQASTL